MAYWKFIERRLRCKNEWPGCSSVVPSAHRHSVSFKTMRYTDEKLQSAKSGFLVRNRIFRIYNSLLSEYACSWILNMDTQSQILTRWCLWEAQFGDFVNGAQIIIDQFYFCCRNEMAAYERCCVITAAWLRRTGPGAQQRKNGKIPSAMCGAEYGYHKYHKPLLTSST